MMRSGTSRGEESVERVEQDLPSRHESELRPHPPGPGELNFFLAAEAPRNEGGV